MVFLTQDQVLIILKNTTDGVGWREGEKMQTIVTE